MAQRDKKVEEPTELRAPELTLCANSCGFFGNPNMLDPRSKWLLRPEQAAASRCGTGTSRPVNLPVFLFGGVVVVGRNYGRGLS